MPGSGSHERAQCRGQGGAGRDPRARIPRRAGSGDRHERRPVMSAAEDLVALVRIDSQNPGMLEGRCAAWLEERLQRAGIGVRRHLTPAGRPNLVAAIDGAGDAPRLVLLAHMDTVPVGEGWSVDPLGGVVRDGAVWGRGAADMKAGLSGALAVLPCLGTGPPPGEAVLGATTDAESPD